jgi:hypothetical protein
MRTEIALGASASRSWVIVVAHLRSNSTDEAKPARDHLERRPHPVRPRRCRLPHPSRPCRRLYHSGNAPSAALSANVTPPLFLLPSSRSPPAQGNGTRVPPSADSGPCVSTSSFHTSYRKDGIGSYPPSSSCFPCPPRVLSCPSLSHPHIFSLSILLSASNAFVLPASCAYPFTLFFSFPSLDVRVLYT